MVEPTREQTAILTLLSQTEHSEAKIREVEWATLDWSALLGSLATNIFPYIHYLCESYDLQDCAPPTAWQTLVAAREDARFRHLIWSSELKRISRTMTNNQVPFLFLKGADLKFRLYPDPSTRPMNDLDLLVDPARFNSAQEALVAAGYTARFDSIEETPSQWRSKPNEEAVYLKPAGRGYLMVELKSVLEMTPGDCQQDWGSICHRSEPHAQVANFAGRVLQPADLLVQLSLHLIYHHSCERGLMWLVDIRLLLERWADQIDWSELEAQCKKDGSFTVVALALHLVNRLFGVSVNDGFVNQVPSREREEMFELAWMQIFYASLEKAPPPGLVRVLGQGRPTQILPLAWRQLHLWTSREWMEEAGVRLAWWRVPGLMFRRILRDMKRYFAAWRGGGMKRDVLRDYKEMKTRADRLKALLID